MIRIVYLIMILALSFGALVVPDATSARGVDMVMGQVDVVGSVGDNCDGCPPTRFADDIPCEGGCPVPCSSSGIASIVDRAHLTRLATSFDIVDPIAEPLIPLGAGPSLEPFPPKLPV